MAITYNLVALLDILFLEYKFDIVWPDIRGLYNFLMPLPSNLRVTSLMKHLKLTNNFKTIKGAGNEEEYGEKSL